MKNRNSQSYPNLSNLPCGISSDIVDTVAEEMRSIGGLAGLGWATTFLRLEDFQVFISDFTQGEAFLAYHSRGNDMQ